MLNRTVERKDSLGSNRYQGPIVSLKNFGHRSTDSFAAVRGDRGRDSFPIVARVVVSIARDRAAGVGGIGSGVARRDGTRCLFHDVVYLLPPRFSSSSIAECKEKEKEKERKRERETTKSTNLSGATSVHRSTENVHVSQQRFVD